MPRRLTLPPCGRHASLVAVVPGVAVLLLGMAMVRPVTAASAALPTDFFVGVSQRMAEMPPPAFTNGGRRPFPGDPLCEPHCGWKCGRSPACDQVCTPACAPPKCQTVCRRTAETCETRCAPPRCAVVCPDSACKDGKCKKCHTVCGPPLCTTQCGEDCHSFCEKPACSWNCTRGPACPMPSCEMKCTGVGKCATNLHAANETRHKAPIFPGKTVVSAADASMDVSSLFAAATPPPAWEMPTPKPASKRPLLRPRSATATEPARAAPPVRARAAAPLAPGGPVRALKQRWAAEDDVNSAR
eukprot:TRINITY_DN28868_c0_g1_i1.p1 TRINITY_DN28868_c0_g1~~TRINITY_DN28868_c0_g1_i1.p1  ORF type:complete len:300 (+),score=36.81 TRINITY_DN28868_c0_g1_i1:152-1051(+)